MHGNAFVLRSIYSVLVGHIVIVAHNVVSVVLVGVVIFLRGCTLLKLNHFYVYSIACSPIFLCLFHRLFTDLCGGLLIGCDSREFSHAKHPTTDS